MALAAYRTTTLRLLNDPTNAVYPIGDVDAAINTGRGQIAAATNCIHYTITRTTTINVDTYLLSSFTNFSAIGGVAAPLVARMGESGGFYLDQREWEWFFKYYICQPARRRGPPERWAVQEPGSLGLIYIDPIPDGAYPMFFDAIALPLNLADDTTTEAIPYPWTDAIPYFAAYLLYQDRQRTADAQAMLQRWGEFMSWGTRQVVSTVLPLNAPGGMGAQTASQRIVNTGFGAPQPGAGG